MKKIKIAILGSNSHIAKGLIYNFLKNKDYILHLYKRPIEKTEEFLNLIGKESCEEIIIHNSYDNFLNSSYDVIINCIGVGTINRLNGDYSKYFVVCEEYDNLIINNLLKNKDSLYIGFSSGAIYGNNFLEPANENTKNCLLVNNIKPEEYYPISKINSEAKHRSFKELNIVDLRLFSYFSRFVDLTDKYFITDLLNCILENKEFVTNESNFIRDYLHPDDLFQIIKKCIDIKKINKAFDVTSLKPVEKKEILYFFSKKYNLKYKIDKSFITKSATGAKNIYYSINKNAESIGYKPKFSSMDTIKEESEYILIGKKDN